jgi:hypothetical protein
MEFVDILFLLSLLLLYFLPKKSENYKWYWIIPLLILFINFGIRIYLINQKHDKADTIFNQETEIAKLETKATDAQRALSELQERLKHRQLTEEQAKYLVTEIIDKSPGDVWLSCKSGDEESCNFGQQIFNILKFAKWSFFNNTLHDVTIHTPNVSSTVGIVISVNDSKSIPLGVELFHKTMMQFGFASRIKESPTKSSVEIFIGVKPQIPN